MKSLVFVSSLFVAAGSACALPFRAVSYEAGGGLPGIVGAGFTVDRGGFFTADGAGDNVVGGTAASMTSANEFEFDSHFALSGFGPSARNRSSTPGNNSAMTLSFYGDYGTAGAAAANWDEMESTTQNGFGPFAAAGAAYVLGPGSHVGDPAADGSNPENSARAGIAVAPPVASPNNNTWFAPNVGGGRSQYDGCFVGRFTIQAGATLSGGLFFSVLTGLQLPDPTASDGNLTLGGPGVAFLTHNGPQLLGLRGYKVGTVDIQNTSAATSAGVNDGEPFGLADVWDLWVQVIPAPGTIALAGLTGLAAIRRRRA